MDADRQLAGATIVLAEGGQRSRAMVESRIPRQRERPAPRPVDWTRVYLECRGAMLDVARKHLARFPDARLEPDDLVHDVFTDVLAWSPREVVDWSAFLLQETVRRVECLDEREWEREEPTVEDVSDDPAAIAVRRVHAARSRRRLVRVLDYMTERQREIARLRLFEGRSVGQIAAAMRTSSSNISQIVTRCLAKLQPTLLQFDTIDENDITELCPPRRVR